MPPSQQLGVNYNWGVKGGGVGGGQRAAKSGAKEKGKSLESSRQQPVGAGVRVVLAS